MILELKPEVITYDPQVQTYCKLPYPKHPHGCPNYGNHRDLKGIRDDLKPRVIRECPPTEFLLDGIFNLSSSMHIIYNIYPVGKDADERMKTNTKLRTNAEFYNVRYWQNRARKQLYDEAMGFLDDNPDTIVDLCPETHGVNLHKLMNKVGIKLEWGEWPPEHSIDNVVYQICLGGYPNNPEFLKEKNIIGRTK